MDKWKTYQPFSCSFRYPPVVAGLSTAGVNSLYLKMNTIVILSTISFFGAKLQIIYFFSAFLCGKVWNKAGIIPYFSPAATSPCVFHIVIHKLSTHLSTVFSTISLSFTNEPFSFKMHTLKILRRLVIFFSYTSIYNILKISALKFC